MLCGGAALVPASTMLVAGSLGVWRSERALYRPLAWTCVATALACLALGAARLAPLVLGVVLVLLLGVPWGVAVAQRVRPPEPATEGEPVTE